MSDPKAEKPQGWGAGPRTREAKLKRRYPTIDDLRRRAKKRVPSFGFDYVEGGAGETEPNVARNRAALDAIEIVPRYGVENLPVSIEVELFGRRYAQPVGIAPMGLPGLMWPGGEYAFADAAQKARIPFTLGSSAGAPIERMAERAPDVIWYQLYRVPRDDLRINFDFVRRAEACGVHVLVLTLDVPARTKRPRELRNDLVIPYRPNFRTIRELLMRPAWLLALLKHGQPSFANYPRYVGENPSHAEVATFVKREVSGAFTWEEVKRFRDKWPRALVVKGILHPEDAERAVSLGVDGVQVSNHGGRQLEGAPASIDVLPAIAAQVGDRATVLFDGGVRSGMDVIRAVALGAKATLTGRPFMYGLGALGPEGPAFVADFFEEEIRAALRQCGVRTLAEAASLAIRHPGAWRFPKVAARPAVAAAE
ncbi:MAG: alpha-hydroxy-acid oxidizing protein [Variibacter sp.]|nr:alpha-hydroxy-acid oxidizing protein [Variibacter sp.]